MERTFKVLIVALAVSGLVAMMGVQAWAGPLLPPLPQTPSFPGVAGESALGNVFAPGDYIRVDWIVQDAAPFGFSGFFAYLYQLENTSTTGEGIRSFNVAFNTGMIVAVGVLDGDDLDTNTLVHQGHNAGNFSNLGPETEPSPGVPNPPSIGNYDILVSPTGVSWNLKNQVNIPKGYESITFFIIDPRPPMYGIATAINTGTVWSSLRGDPVPVPSPEPATLILLSLGMGLMGFLRRRSR